MEKRCLRTSKELFETFLLIPTLSHSKKIATRSLLFWCSLLTLIPPLLFLWARYAVWNTHLVHEMDPRLHKSILNDPCIWVALMAEALLYRSTGWVSYLQFPLTIYYVAQKISLSAVLTVPIYISIFYITLWRVIYPVIFKINYILNIFLRIKVNEYLLLPLSKSLL